MSKSLTLPEIKRMFDCDYVHNQSTRIKAADDRVFAYVTQWDDGLLDDTMLAYKGEFNIIRRATREIMADLRANPVQIDFEPTADSRDEGADLLDGLYLTDDRMNTSIEAYATASQEAVDCGIGGWELYTEWRSNRSGDRHQVIRRRPIYEFNNNAFPDSNAKLLDKSDARRWTILEPYSKEGYQALYKELTGDDTDANPVNFASPETSYVFPWIMGNEMYYVARFYHKSKVKDKVLTLTDPFGQVLKVRGSDLVRQGEEKNIDIMDDLIDQGYEIVYEKPITRWQVKCYVASGEKILREYVIAGDKIPVIPMYGERAFIEGEEYYEGVIRLAKDPQRLRNFLMSYLGDLVARGPREKPIFTPEQIAGFKFMYEENGPDNNYPYLLQNATGPNGESLPLGPVGQINPPGLPQALGALVDLTRQAVEDVANPGLPKDIADADISGRAVELLQARLDNQSSVYQDNLKHAKRYDAMVYASMASVVYDAPRPVTITLPDGSRKIERVMDTIVDKKTGELVTINDLTNIEFEVYAKIGPSYHSKREKTRDELGAMADDVREADPVLHKALVLKRLQLMDGINVADIKEYVDKQLMLAGFKEPETEEEIQFMEEAQQMEQEPDAAMKLAEAEQAKAEAEQIRAQAAVMREDRLAVNDQARASNDALRTDIDAFRAQTDRASVEVEAAKAGTTIRLNEVKTRGVEIDNTLKLTDRFRARLRPTAA
jgi:hypothetical protein